MNASCHDNGQKLPVPYSNGELAELRIRPARQSDLVPLTFFVDALLRRDYFLRRGQLAGMLRDRYHRILVAELDHILVGLAITTRGTHLVNLLVHPAYRRLGIGRSLVERSNAASANVKLDMRSGNPRGFYEALGFGATGKRNRKGNIELMRLVSRAAPRRMASAPVSGSEGGPRPASVAASGQSA